MSQSVRRRRVAGFVSSAITVTSALFLVCCGLDVAGSFVAAADAATATPETGADLPSRPDAAEDGDLPVDAAHADASIDAPVDAGPAPATFLSPFHPSGTLTYQQPIDWTIASASATAIIHYTTDGSPPAALSPTAVGKVTLAALPDNTTIRWSVEPSPTVYSFLVHVDATKSSATQAFVDRVAFTNGSPVIKAAPGATLSGTGRAIFWNGPCPSCIDQLLVGVGTGTSEDCLTDENPGTFPGVTTTGAPFSVKAPVSPGTYKVKTGFTQQFNCKPDAIGKALGTTEIATIIVE